jgi:ABC-type molybdate transport system substrate-binding protein
MATYPIAVARGDNPAGGEAFANFVLSQSGREILAKWGFLTGQSASRGQGL